MVNRKRILGCGCALSAALLVLTSCVSATQELESSESTESATPAQSETPRRDEVQQLTPRVFLTFDGGVMALNAQTGEHVGTVKEDGFLRLSALTDGRHIVVADGDEFKVLDSGLVAREHGDHNHYYEQNPMWTGVRFDAPEASHAVSHHGKTALFSDGDGQVQVVDNSVFAQDAVEQSQIIQRATSGAHHGVAVPLSDDGLLVTQGDEEHRDTIQALDKEGKLIAETTDCPGVHGEAVVRVASRDVVSVGCENGPVVYKDGKFHKVDVPEDYQRSGNQFSAPDSHIVLTDYKVDQDADLERPTRIGLIDTQTAQMKTVDLGSPYWFRSFGYGKGNKAVVLTYDGNLNMVDTKTGEISGRVKVVDHWEESEDWQEPGPAVQVLGEYVYITEPGAKKLHVVNIERSELVESFELPEVPNEMMVVDGKTEK